MERDPSVSKTHTLNHSCSCLLRWGRDRAQKVRIPSGNESKTLEEITL